MAGRFMVLWVLVGLLAFYIVSVYFGSSTFFAVGNIIVEIILIVHVVRNRTD